MHVIFKTGKQKSNFDIYLFDEGYLKTSSQEYDLDSEDFLVHLTNSHLQSNSDNFGKHEKGNIVTFPELQKYLDEEYPKLKVNI